MLREPASSPQFVPQPLTFEDDSPIENLPSDVDAMRELVEPYLAIAYEGRISVSDLPTEDQAIILRGESDLLMTFSGYLKQEAEIVYDVLDKALTASNRFPLLRENQDSADAPHIIHIFEGRLKESTHSRVWLNLLLFILTVFSVFFTGAQQGIIEAGILNPTVELGFVEYIMTIMRELWRGYPYALSIMAILVAHEMGHYLMMRRYGINASLPYFIPAWLISPFGTFGAAIVLRDVLKNRKILLDVGAAGPIAGFIVAVPLVIYGLSTSEIIPIHIGGQIEGNSLIYAFAKIVALGKFYPTAEADVLINQIAFAGWTGLFVTALNMMPLGQLDGGHVMYSLFGDKARLAFYPIMLGLIGISLLSSQITWLFFLLILFLIGRFYAVPLDAITPLNQSRRIVAAIALVIFMLTFTPMPFYTLSATAIESTHAGALSQWASMLVIALLTIPRWWKIRQL